MKVQGFSLCWSGLQISALRESALTQWSRKWCLFVIDETRNWRASFPTPSLFPLFLNSVFPGPPTTVLLGPSVWPSLSSPPSGHSPRFSTRSPPSLPPPPPPCNPCSEGPPPPSNSQWWLGPASPRLPRRVPERALGLGLGGGPLTPNSSRGCSGCTAWRSAAQPLRSHGLAGAEGERAEPGRGLFGGLAGSWGAWGQPGPTARERYYPAVLGYSVRWAPQPRRAGP